VSTPRLSQDDAVTLERTDTAAGYNTWLAELKIRIREARLRASLAVNAELIGLYWRIGRDILERQERDGWGARVVDRLAVDLRAAFPQMKGFSRANLLYMRAFDEAWPDPEIVQRVVGRLPWGQNIDCSQAQGADDPPLVRGGDARTRLEPPGTRPPDRDPAQGSPGAGGDKFRAQPCHRPTPISRSRSSRTRISSIS
jgi:predicted nuclease of restriction endonuclease-like (RecB) superfamily